MNIFFILLSAIALSSALGVILMRNPIHSALCLIVNLVAIAGYFALLNAHFLALVQIIVYAGAIMVLVVFVLMLLNSKLEEQKSAGLFMLVVSSVFAVMFIVHMSKIYGAEFSTSGVASASLQGTVANLGRVLFTQYVFSFEASAVLLMAAIVGAAMLAKTTPERPRGDGERV